VDRGPPRGGVAPRSRDRLEPGARGGDRGRHGDGSPGARHARHHLRPRIGRGRCLHHDAAAVRRRLAPRRRVLQLRPRPRRSPRLGRDAQPVVCESPTADRRRRRRRRRAQGDQRLPADVAQHAAGQLEHERLRRRGRRRAHPLSDRHDRIRRLDAVRTTSR
jgi:hypothetical protein